MCPRASQLGEELGGDGQRQCGELVQLREGSEG